MATATGADRIVDTILGYRQAKVLMVAADLEVFTHLRRPATAARTAGALALDERGTEILLDALVAMGMLSKAGGRYANTPVSRAHLVKGAPGYMGDNLKFQESIWEAWSGLGEAVRRGRPTRDLGDWLDGGSGMTEQYIRGMDNIARRPARELSDLLELPASGSMLDVGGGPGTYTRTLLEPRPGMRGVIMDLPGTLKVTRTFFTADRHLRRRVRLEPGDYRKTSFGEAIYDLVLMSHITHDESPSVNRLLFKKGFRALRPGGTLVVHDFVVEDDRTAPLFGAMFSVHMLAYTAQGRTYTAREYEGWLREAGFRGFSRHPLCAGAKNASWVIVARKPG